MYQLMKVLAKNKFAIVKLSVEEIVVSEHEAFVFVATTLKQYVPAVKAGFTVHDVDVNVFVLIADPLQAPVYTLTVYSVAFVDAFH